MKDYFFTIDFTKEIKKDILGVGIEWDPPMYDITPDLTDKQWELIFSRLDFFRLKFTRVMMYSPLPQYGTENDYEDRRVKNILRVLEYCQKNNVVVMLGYWNKPWWVERYDDSVFIRSIADLLLWLKNEKHITCVKYFNFVNEPNGYWEISDNNWLQWKPAVEALHKEFEARGVLENTKICGPDSAYDDEWVDMCIAAIPHVIGDYEYHIYLHDKAEIIENKFESRLRHKRWAITKNDPDGKNKRLWLGEFGCRDGRWNEATDMQNSVHTFVYGVWLADAVCQVFRAGLDGIIPWQMDDAAHPAGDIGGRNGTFKSFGFWNIYGGQTITGSESGTSYPISAQNIRPWFYPMSLFSRLFKQGGTIIDTGSIQDYIKICALKKDDRFSIVVINASDEPASVSLVLDGLKGLLTGDILVKKYVYFEDDRPVDKNGFPAVKEELKMGDLVKSLEMPAKGVVFLSTV